MTKYAIIGYGKLGKQMANLLQQKGEDFCVFSRRAKKTQTEDFSTLGADVTAKNEKASNINQYAPNYPILPLGDIEGANVDVAFICCGSATDSTHIAPYVARFCNTIDCYDNHAKMDEYISNLRDVAIQYSTTCIVGAGWDPGLMSVIRTYFSLVGEPVTLWGKGVSQGHTNALLSCNGVIDAVAFTLPKRNVLKGTKKRLIPTNLHTRLCYVVASKGVDKKKLAYDIKSMPDYFYGYKVKVRFCTLKGISKYKTLFHKGRVVAYYNGIALDFRLTTQNNPLLTAQIMYGYALAISKLSTGAHSVLDIPCSVLLGNSPTKYL